MNVTGIIPNFGEIFTVKNSANNNNNYTGPSFAESFKSTASAANMQVAGGSNASSLQFSRQKEEHIKPFSFTDAEEEIAETYLAKIDKLLKDLTK